MDSVPRGEGFVKGGGSLLCPKCTDTLLESLVADGENWKIHFDAAVNVPHASVIAFLANCDEGIRPFLG